jgi:hypothetical protein
MNRRQIDGDPIEALRKADPLDRRPVPEETLEAHRRALFQEITDMDTMEKETPAPVRRRGVRIAVAASAVAAVAAATIGGYALLNRGAEPRINGGEAVGAGGVGTMCIQYTDEILATQQQAFDGTVTAIDGTHVTFDVRHWYAGGSDATVTLEADGLTGTPNGIFEGGVPLEVGKRYLVTANDGIVWSCGYTMTFDSDMADHWASVFGA